MEKARVLHIGVVALEPSADVLAADFMRRLSQVYPAVRWSGVGGVHMEAAGLSSAFPMAGLSRMGLWEVLPALPHFWRVHRHLVTQFLMDRPDAFVGFDAPDFNLRLAARLKRAGIRTSHVVSPSVWAWRRNRIYTVAQSCDHLFALFPFELPYYAPTGLSVSCMGYPPMAHLPLDQTPQDARLACGLPPEGRCLVLLPGSRVQEIRALGGRFVQAAQHIQAASDPPCFDTVCVAVRDQQAWEGVQASLVAAGGIPNQVPIIPVIGRTPEAIAAADLVLACSGTVTLETMLINRPLVIAYRCAPWTAALVRRFLQVSFVGLPNILTGRALVPECLQAQAEPAALAAAVRALWADPVRLAEIHTAFQAMRAVLQAGVAQWIPDFIRCVLPPMGEPPADPSRADCL